MMLAWAVPSGGSYAAEEAATERMDISAQEMIYEQKLERVTASGDVTILQQGRTLQADKVIYSIKEDRAFAQGHVVLTDVNGDVHRADQIELQDAFKNGLVKTLSSVLKDGSRITARQGQRIDAKKIILRDAWYTPCKPCQANPDEAPDWNVTADEVMLDQDAHRVTYKNAKFVLFGVPVLYTPYLSHSDGTIKQKSGLLTPRVGYSSQIGAFAETRYYHAIAPDKDATTGVMVTGREGAVALGEYRQRFNNAEIGFGGSITQSTRPLDNDQRSDEEIRGSLNGDGRWDVNDKWRAGYHLDVASDDQYLRQYKMPYEDVLENEVYIERFDDRDYAGVRALAFQDTRTSRDDTDQPHVAPWAEIEHYSAPRAILGGRTKVAASTVGLVRPGQDQDMQRFTAEAEWNRRTILPGGVVNDTDTSVRGDLYAVQDRFDAGAASGQSSADTTGRNFLQLHSQFAYPLAKRLPKGQMIVEPRAALTTSNDIRDLDDIPNEDSQDVDFTIGQLFAKSRFTGYDRVDDGTRATVGLATQYIADEGGQGEVFFGQSYRLSNDANPFPNGSGLEQDRSDFVGRVRYDLVNGSSFEYSARYDDETMAAQRHDVTVNYDGQWMDLAATYFYLAPFEGSDLTEDQEQIALMPSFQIAKNWRVRSGVRYDLSGDQNERGLQTSTLGLDYTGDCITYSVTANRNNLDEESGESDNEIFFRVGFKNLGEIETSPLSLNNNDEEDKNENK